jgi:ubiquinone biosynthesis protein Coq4
MNIISRIAAPPAVPLPLRPGSTTRAVHDKRGGADRQRQREYRKNNLRSLYAAYRLAKDPEHTKYVFMIGDAQDNIAESERRLGQIADPFRAGPLEAMWQTRFRAERYDIDALMQLPGDTLGGAYARHMKANGLRPDYYDDDVVPRHRWHYLRLRIRQTHDIWHVLTGFTPDEFGEVGIQGFYAAQFANGQAAIIAAAAILKSVLRGRFGDLERHLEAFCEGYHGGKHAESLLAVKWEELWGENLEELRRRYRIATPRLRFGAAVAASE